MGASKDPGKLQLPTPDGGSGEHAVRRPEEGKAPVVAEPPARRTVADDSRLVSLRHHASLWLAPAALLVAALFPWPYGYYDLLRLGVFVVSGWIAYEQWRHDDAISGWVVAFGAAALLYNPVWPIHLTREIWSVLNIATAVLFVGHLGALTRLVANESKGHRLLSLRTMKRMSRRLRILPRSLGQRLLPRR